MKQPVITIDGPVGAGKTTAAEIVSKALGYLFIDTGLFYRSVAWLMLQRGLDPSDEGQAAGVAEEMEIGLRRGGAAPAEQVVQINGRDATGELYSPKVEGAVSIVSKYPKVRGALLPKQRAFLEKGGVIVAGRDIGTVVWPDAELKIYLDARVDVRAKRKYDERVKTHGAADYDQILALLKQRDRIDSERKVSPLRIPEGAEYIDTNAITAEQVAEVVLAALSKRTRAGRATGTRQH